MRGTYSLPEDLRARLGRPLGRFFPAKEVGRKQFASAVASARMVVTVGDRVTDTLSEFGRVPDVQVVDGMERRKRRIPPRVPYARLIRVRNPAGTLTGEAIRGMKSAFAGRKPVRVLVEGEEDLVAIPAIALAPVSAVVFYGQPGEGVVAVKADFRSKARSRKFLAEMGIAELG